MFPTEGGQLLVLMGAIHSTKIPTGPTGKVVHLKRWTRFFETFPVGPNRSIEFWTEISRNFGWMDRAQLVSVSFILFITVTHYGTWCQHLGISYTRFHGQLILNVLRTFSVHLFRSFYLIGGHRDSKTQFFAECGRAPVHNLAFVSLHKMKGKKWKISRKKLVSPTEIKTRFSCMQWIVVDYS